MNGRFMYRAGVIWYGWHRADTFALGIIYVFVWRVTYGVP